MDAHSFERATSVGQTGGAVRLEESLVALTSDPAHHSERESVLNTLAWQKKNRKEPFALTIFESHILELSDTEEDRTDAPTPLHAVGTWKQPSSSSVASQVRLLDAAIHTFAATFGMQDGRAQDKASRALSKLLPASLLQSAKSLSVTASSLITENEKKKPKVRIVFVALCSAESFRFYNCIIIFSPLPLNVRVFYRCISFIRTTLFCRCNCSQGMKLQPRRT